MRECAIQAVTRAQEAVEGARQATAEWLLPMPQPTDKPMHTARDGTAIIACCLLQGREGGGGDGAFWPCASSSVVALALAKAAVQVLPQRLKGP